MYGILRSSYYKTRYDYFREFYKINTSFGFNGTDIRIYGDGEIKIGDNSYIGSLSTIQLTKGYCVTIGNYCSISHNVRIYTNSSLPDQDFRNNDIKETKSGNVSIGNGVWIGANVFINPGITINDNSVIGANSVVTKDVPNNAIFGGVPAKLIRFKND